MDATALTIVSQLIVDAQTRYSASAVRRVDVAPELLDDTMEQVLALGGRVGLDWCIVDGVEIGGLPDDVDFARAWLHDQPEPHSLEPLEDDRG